MTTDLIDRLELGTGASPDHHLLLEAANELRRLHGANQEMLEALKLATKIIGFGKEWDQISAAIDKAEQP